MKWQRYTPYSLYFLPAGSYWRRPLLDGPRVEISRYISSLISIMILNFLPSLLKPKSTFVLLITKTEDKITDEFEVPHCPART